MKVFQYQLSIRASVIMDPSPIAIHRTINTLASGTRANGGTRFMISIQCLVPAVTEIIVIKNFKPPTSLLFGGNFFVKLST